MSEEKKQADEINTAVPISATDLATVINRGRSYVCAMKAAGYQFTHCNRTMLPDALKWLRKNPDFRSTSYHSAASKPRKRLPRPRLVAAGNSDAQAH